MTLVPLNTRTVNDVEFEDADGDVIRFRVAPNGIGMLYSVNGVDRDVFMQVRYSPGMGVAGVAMPDIDKGFPIPPARAADILGGIRHMALKSYVTCKIDEYVTVPAGTVVGLVDA